MAISVCSPLRSRAAAFPGSGRLPPIRFSPPTASWSSATWRRFRRPTPGSSSAPATGSPVSSSLTAAGNQTPPQSTKAQPTATTRTSSASRPTSPGRWSTLATGGPRSRRQSASSSCNPAGSPIPTRWPSSRTLPQTTARTATSLANPCRPFSTAAAKAAIRSPGPAKRPASTPPARARQSKRPASPPRPS